MLTNTFLVTSRSVIESLLSWIEYFYLELQAGGRSWPQDEWLLVCIYVRYYFKELKKVRVPAQWCLTWKGIGIKMGHTCG